MPVRQETKQIEDSDGLVHEYLVIQKPADQGEVLKFEMLSIFGPMIKALKEALTIKDDQGKALEIFGEAISVLFEKNSPADIFNFLQKLVLGIRRDGAVITPINFNEFYTDNMMECYKACMFMLQVNYGNFFKGLKLPDNIGAILQPLKNQ